MPTPAEIESLRAVYQDASNAADIADAALLSAQTTYGVSSPQATEAGQRAAYARSQRDQAQARYEAVLPPTSSGQTPGWVPFAVGAAVLGVVFAFATPSSEPARELRYARR